MRLAQPVLRRMLRMWLAAVCSLMKSVGADLAVARGPRATRPSTCASRAEMPSGRARRPVARRARRSGASSAGMPIRSASAAASASSASARSRSVAAESEQQARVLVRGVGDPGRRPHARGSAPARVRSARSARSTHRASPRACRGSGPRRRSTRPGGRSSRSRPRAARARGTASAAAASSPSAAQASARYVSDASQSDSR